MSIELPPLHVVAKIGPDFISGNPSIEIPVVTESSALARERILLARVAELEAVLAKFDERWLMDGELGFCVSCGAEYGEDHKPECWAAEANAARGAK